MRKKCYFLLCFGPHCDYQERRPNIKRWLCSTDVILNTVHFRRWVLNLALLPSLGGWLSSCWRTLKFYGLSLVVIFSIEPGYDTHWANDGNKQSHILLHTVEIALLSWIVHSDVTTSTCLRLQMLHFAGHVLRMENSRIPWCVMGDPSEDEGSCEDAVKGMP